MQLHTLAKGRAIAAVWFLFASFLLVGCGASQPLLQVDGVDVEVTAVEFSNEAELPTQPQCSNQFVRHELDHITTNQYEPVDMYDSNGAGVAVNDLDNDGDVDIVLANLAGDNHIFWNNGDLTFDRWAFPYGSSRAVATVDVDADGLLDIVFTSRIGKGLLYWHNEGDQTFEEARLPGIDQHAYSMAWADLDADGDLDVVTGSYDTALEKELRDAFMFGDGAGVFVFTNQGDGTFTSKRLAEKSQALALLLTDLNGDGRKDILVGNDFITVRDYAWLATDAGWVEAEPFATTTENTMSFDVGDVNNDGSMELFAADMHPYSAEIMPDYMPMMEAMMDNHDPIEGDPQVMANVLQVRDADGNFVDQAEGMAAAATGWSWSTKFGDLDQDGYLDLYSVNGMASFESFGHLPNNTLVEENQVLHNDGFGHFEPMPTWNLTQTDGGRGMSMADFDNDGDLDIVINNLLSSATLLENQLCLGASLQLNLQQLASDNRFAIGAVATLHTSMGDLTRDVRALSGYLSGDTTQLHFGFPEDAELDKLTISWPDGQITTISNLEPNQTIKIKRGE